MPGPRRHSRGAGRGTSPIHTAVHAHLEALNGRDLDRLVGFYAEEAVLELPASPKVEGREAIRRAFEAFFAQWEERSTYEQVVVEGSTAAVEGMTTGSHRTLHLRIPGRIPTGTRQYHHAFAAFLEFGGGLIVRHRVYYDARELVRQLLG